MKRMSKKASRRRFAVTNSLLSTADLAGDFWIEMAVITNGGMQLEKGFYIDMTKLSRGPARPHDMLLN